MTILICMISPLHNALRYMLPVVAMTPLILGITLLAGCTDLVEENDIITSLEDK